MSTLPDDPSTYCFIDTETRALPGLPDPRWGDVTTTSVDRYAKSSKVIMLQYAIGEGPVKVWALQDFTKALSWRDLPPDLADFMARMYRGEAWMVAHNSRFDRLVMNGGMVRSRKAAQIPIRSMLDAAVQTAAANLPRALDRAHKAVGGAGKLPDGKKLIQQFCRADGDTPESHPEDWATFCDYGVQDIEAMRDVFLQTRPLTIWEWEDFWAAEAVNDRGLPMDTEFLTAAAQLADELQLSANDRVKEYTHGACRTVNQHVALAQWVFEELSGIPEVEGIMTRKYAEEEGEMVPSKISLDRERVQLLIPLLERIDRDEGLTDAEYDVLQLLEVREFGASATPKKFRKAEGMLDGRGRLGGQYVFNGAQQSGRYSSRGLQVHNLTRSALKNEADAIEAIMDLYEEEK